VSTSASHDGVMVTSLVSGPGGTPRGTRLRSGFARHQRSPRCSYCRRALGPERRHRPAYVREETLSVHRYYDPATEQFLSVDPLASITEDPYGFVAQDPVNLTDPSRLAPGCTTLQECIDFINQGNAILGRGHNPARVRAWQEWYQGNKGKIRSCQRKFGPQLPKLMRPRQRNNFSGAPTPVPAMSGVPATPPSPELNGNWGFHPPSPAVAAGLGLGGALLLIGGAILLAPAGA